ncbi:MAG TPA: RHS repeat-associated core domain-containing protein, partial [Chthonomonas sp.]|uniref:RHS repeat domain-containing protein n=1 Tax=Chthonomonas sp. TaxID=2282153 RepID=UPI002B4AFB4E
PLARSSGGRVLLYTPDGQGNVSQQVDAGSGNVVASYLFDGYGVRKVASSDPTASQDPYSGYGGLEGYYTDWETGLSLLGFRYYDVLAGRFLTRDPIGFAGGINLYEYVGNCPLTGGDRTGTRSLGDFLHDLGPNVIKQNPILQCLVNMADGGLGMLGTLVPGLLQGDYPPIKDIICQLTPSCLSGFLTAFIGGALNALSNGAASLLDGCLAGLISSVVTDYLNYLCSEPKCSAERTPSACQILQWVLDAIAACLSGIGGITTDPEKDAMKDGMEGIIIGLLVDLGLMNYDAGEACKLLSN